MTPHTAITVALVGNPNSGKSTLFNALSGLRQHVGNYAGVTVDMKKGTYTHGAHTVTVIDPGVPNQNPAAMPETTATYCLPSTA